MHSVLSNAAVCGIETVVPSKKINIDDEIGFFDNNPKKLARAKKILGLGTRHVVDTGTTTVDLCRMAASDLLSKMAVPPETIDALILVNQSPAYLHPAGACMLQDMLTLSKSCAAFDVGMGCSGFVYGLWLAHTLIQSGCNTVLLCAGDTPSIHSDIRNRKHNPLFGDAGSATLIKKTKDLNPAFFDLGTDGSGWDKIIIPAGGSRLRPRQEDLERCITDKNGNVWRPLDDLIQGQAVFEFSVNIVPQTIRSVLQLAQCELNDIDFIALHQANRQIIEEIGARLDLPKGNLYSTTFTRYGNQSTASVAGVLCDALREKMADHDLKLLLCGFGVGFSWATALVRFHHCFNGGVQFYTPPQDMPSQEQEVEHWQKIFREE